MKLLKFAKVCVQLNCKQRRTEMKSLCQTRRLQYNRYPSGKDNFLNPISENIEERIIRHNEMKSVSHLVNKTFKFSSFILNIFIKYICTMCHILVI